MKPIQFDEIKNIIEYEKVRNDFRKKVIAIKDHRRLKIGEIVTLTFENRYTVTFQIEEMMRIERIIDDVKIRDEVETYNELIPRQNELSATLFVEIEEQSKIKPLLDSLIGMNKDSLFLRIGNRMIPAVFEEGHSTDDRISAVQYIRFKMAREEAEMFGNTSVEVKAIISHKNYNAEVVMPSELRRALYEDMTTGAAANVWN